MVAHGNNRRVMLKRSYPLLFWIIFLSGCSFTPGKKQIIEDDFIEQITAEQQAKMELLFDQHQQKMLSQGKGRGQGKGPLMNR